MMPKIRLVFRAEAPKAGNSLEECEDQSGVSEERGIYALADGASEASYSKTWAGILVREFCDVGGPVEDMNGFETWLDTCRNRWRVWERELHSKQLPWFAQEKLAQGSFSTFLGVSFHAGESYAGQGIWKAIACGDSCLFVVQQNWLTLSFPCEGSQDFSNAPPLLSSLPYPVRDDLAMRQGSISPGDRVYLMTDALAHWFLQLYEKNEKPWQRLDELTTQPEFDSFISVCRSREGMRNDDVAFMRLLCEASSTKQ